MHDETALVRKARAGDLNAFSELVIAHQAHVRAYLGGCVRDPSVVDDLAQETFLAAYRGMGRFGAESTLRTWLIGIARRKALMHMREAARSRARSGRHTEQVLAQTFTTRLECEDDIKGEMLRALHGCIDKLPADPARLLRSYYFERTPVADLAAAKGKSPNAINIMLHRVREALRKCVSSALPAQGAGA